MGYWEHDCDGCKCVHDALCGVKYYELGEKAGWAPLEPPGPQPSK
jgi:hypothetical protein